MRLTRSRVRVNGSAVELVDLPGVYSLTATSPVERAARDFLLGGNADVIINVVDAALLSRGLELTLELLDLGIPVVVCLNMADEARRRGMTISAETLSHSLGVPVVETVASRGTGVAQLFSQALKSSQAPHPPQTLVWPEGVERAIERLEIGLAANAKNRSPAAPSRFVAVKLLEGDEEALAQASPAARELAAPLRHHLAEASGESADLVMMTERRRRAERLAAESTTFGHPRTDFRAALDRLLTHPLFGYVFLVLILVGFFWAVFGIGAWLERELLALLGSAFQPVGASLGSGTMVSALVRSLWDGFVGGATIVLPYLLPFLFGLALLEDAGYLPRVAYLLDGLLHRIGLHGTSVVPIMLGYGCSVPACLSTRVLPSRRDRFLASVLATLVPCSARSTVIFALAAFYLGPAWALAIFAFNALVVFFSGWLLARLWPEVSIGMILEVPRYQWPSLRMTSRKVWLRLREFVVVSWPLLILGSGILGLAEFWHADRYINSGLSPLMSLLGLPAAVGVTLIFGVLRKELSMVMLVQALGTTNIHSVLTSTQILTFTVFLTFYIPCLATLAAMAREIGKKLTALAAAYSFALATLLGIAVRFLPRLFALP